MSTSIELMLFFPGTWKPENTGTASLCRPHLSVLRYLQDQLEEAESLLNQSEEKTRECFGEESEPRLIVTYGDLAWLKYHIGDDEQSQAYCQRVHDILVCVHILLKE